MSVIVTVSEILGMESGTTVAAARGKILSIDERFTGQNTRGDWSVQRVVIQDKTGKIDVKFWGFDPFPSNAVGKLLTVMAKDGSRGMTGLKTDFDDRTKRICLKATASAEYHIGVMQMVGDDAETDADRQQNQPPQSPPTQPGRSQSPPASSAPLEPRAKAVEDPAYHGAPSTNLPVRKRVHKLARLYLYCLDGADYILANTEKSGCPLSATTDRREIATTLFIEMNRKGFFDFTPNLEPWEGRTAAAQQPARGTAMEDQGCGGDPENDDVPF